MASEESRRRLPLVDESAARTRGPVNQRDAQTLLREIVRRREPGRPAAEDEDGLSVRTGHENRLRSQTPAANRRRSDVVSLTRGPKTTWSPCSMRRRISE